MFANLPRPPRPSNKFFAVCLIILYMHYKPPTGRSDGIYKKLNKLN